MNNIVKWLQSNPLVVIGMFTVSLASGIATLVLGWKQLYADYLSKSVDVPVWLILLAVLFVPGVQALFRYHPSKTPSKELERFEGKNFGVQQIAIDGKLFERCEFHQSQLIFSGADSFGITRCTFVGQPVISFSGSAALTIGVLSRRFI